MSNKEQILDLFYNSHLKQTEIAEIVKLSTQYISRIVKKDSKYEQEKAYRKKLSKENSITLDEVKEIESNMDDYDVKSESE